MALNLRTETVFTDDAPAALPPLPPEQIAPHFPQLEILECLGRGGMGVVYKARQKSLNRLVALKLLAPERVQDAQFAARFTREAQALAALNHPNIVTIHDFGQAGGFYYLLMEFVDGLNLRQLMRSRKFTPEEALAIVPALCDALQFAHDRGIVHRDIKPDNLLLDQAGRLKVADFGIAKMLGAVNGQGQAGEPRSTDNVTQTAVGTPGYSAPEQKTDPQRVDHRADIYSLGVVFYELLTGELPGKKIEPPSKKVQIDVRLDEVVLRALENKPELRFQQVSQVKTCVETIAETPPGGGRLAGVPRDSTIGLVLGAWSWRGPWPLAAVAILFILTGSFSAWLFAQNLWSSVFNPDISISFPFVPFGPLALPCGIGLLRRRPGWRRLALAAIWFCVALIFISSGLALTAGVMVTYVRIAWAGHEVLGPAKGWLGLLGFTLSVGLLVWPYRVLTRAEVKTQFQKTAGSRSGLEWGTLAAALFLAVLISRALLAAGLDRLNSTLGDSSFDPVVESTLHVEHPGGGFFDLASGQATTPPPGVDPIAWMLTGPKELVLATDGQEGTRLGLANLWSHSVRNTVWNQPSLLDETTVLLLTTNLPAAQSHLEYFGRGRVPQTIAFRSPHHRAGLLQITGFIENRPGVEFRYKLLPMTQPRPARASSDPENTNSASASALQFRLVLPEASTESADWLPSASGPNRFHVSRQVLLDGAAIAQAGLDFGPYGREIEISFTDAGRQRFEAITATNLHRQLAMVFRGQVLSAPTIASAIPSGQCQVLVGALPPGAVNEIVDCLNRTAPPTVGAGSFSSMYEKILPCQPQPNPLFGWLALDSGTIMTNSTLDWQSRTGSRWIRTNGLDVVTTESSKNVPMLLGFDLVVARLPTNGWDMVTAADVIHNWTLMRQEHRQEQIIGALPDGSDTFLFQTREGGSGLLQITGFTEDPPGVKIRYKLVRSTINSPGAILASPGR